MTIRIIHERARVGGQSFVWWKFHLRRHHPFLTFSVDATGPVEILVAVPQSLKDLRDRGGTDDFEFFSLPLTLGSDTVFLPDDGPWVFAILNRQPTRVAATTRVELRRRDPKALFDL